MLRPKPWKSTFQTGKGDQSAYSLTPMNILAMDTCFGACSVAVGKTVQEFGTAWHHEFEPRQTGHAEALMPMVERVMGEAELHFSQLERIAVTTGPGSFTGMRIGIAAARAMGVTLGIPVVGLPTLDVMALDAGSAHSNDNADETPALGQHLIIAIDARKDQVYAQQFDGNQHRVNNAAVLSYLEAAELGGLNDVTICGSGAEMVATERRRLGRPVTVKFPSLQPSALSLGMTAVALRDVENFPARPLYLRPPDAKPQDGKSLARAP
jgi:tRNA threonylcarbamoyladenosine biosynthesis protein TsaB